MSKFIKKLKRSLAIALSVTTFAWALGPVALLLPTQALAATAQAGDLIKMDGLASVYYLGADSKRYVFPNETAFKSWYSDFSGVKTISQSELESYSLGANVTIRPGTKLVKITTDPKVYAVETGGVLKWIPDEATATTLYGANWAQRVVDVPDAFFTNYTVSTAQVSATAYPEGTLIKYAGSSDIYLVTSATQSRKIATMDALTANRYKEADIVTAPATITYTAGTEITAAESALVDLSSTGVTPGDGDAVVGTGLTVSLSSATAASGTIIAGQAVANLGSFDFAAGSDGAVKVTKVKVKRSGVSADTTLANVYLYDGDTRLTDNASVSSGYITWTNSAGVFTVAAGTTKTISVKSDIASDTSGQTVSVSLQVATDIETDGATVSGTFPVNTNVMSIASATLAGVNFSATMSPTTGNVDPQDDYTMWANTVSFTTRAVYLHSLSFRQIGSIETKDLKDFELYIAGTKVGETVASVDSTGYIQFKPATPYKIEAGSREIKVVGDIVNGSGRNFIISLRRAADAIFVDSEYNANVLVQTNSATFSARDSGTMTIASGELSITKATDSPTGNIVNNGSQVTLAKFQLKATGENMKVENLRVTYTYTDQASETVNELRNGTLYYNGAVVGSTADIKEDSYSTGYTEYSLGSQVIVVPGSPGTLEVKADVYDGEGTTNDIDATDTIVVKIAVGSNNVQRQSSLGYLSRPSSVASANTLTVAEGSLVLSKDQNYGNQAVVVPTTATKLARFNLRTGTTESVNLTSFTVDFTVADALAVADDITNVYLTYGSKETSLKGTVSATAGANTWSISETMAANADMNIEIYGDLASGATDSDATEDTVIASLKVTGTTSNSGTTVYTGAGATGTVLAGQIITATGAGTLTVQLADDTPVASIAVAGTQPAGGSIKLKLTNTREPVYITKLTFRVDSNSDDIALASADLYAGASGSLSQADGGRTFVLDGTNPGYFSWTLSGNDRIRVPSDTTKTEGTTYVLVKPTYVPSGQKDTVVSGLTPALFLADLEAEASSVLTPSSGTPNLVNDTGIIVKAGGSATYVDSTEDTLTTALTATATTLVTGNTVTFAAGDIIFVDGYNADGEATADGKWNAAYEELMVVLVDGGASLTVDRGAFGTTALASTVSKNIYLLNGGVADLNKVTGTATTIVKTKPTISLAADNPSGATSGGTQKPIFKFTVTAESNIADSNENKVSMKNLDLAVSKAGVTVKNAKIYPVDKDQNEGYVILGSALSATEWRFDLDSLTNDPAAYYQVLKGTSRTFIIRADVGTPATASSLEVSIASILSGGDVTWSDETTDLQWVDQTGASYLSGQALTYTAGGSATTDTTAPTISTIVGANGTTAASLDTLDTITITFAEMMDPTTINASLVPGSSVTGVLATATGGVTGEADDGVITVTGITTFDSGATLAADASFTTNLALNSTGTVLTITLNTGTARVIGTPAMGTGTTVAGTVKDVNGTAMAAVASVLPTGSF